MNKVLVGTAVWALAALVDPSSRTGITLVAPAYAQAKTAQQQMGVRATGGGRMSIDVQGAEIRTVLRSISA